MTHDVPPPPRWARRLLRAVLPHEDAATVLGDLEELYELRVRRDGRGAARRWYARHAMRFALRVLGARALPGPFVTRGRGGGGGMGTSLDEVAKGMRRLARAPVFTAVSVGTVGVAIGAFASVFSVVDAVLLEDPPYDEPGELVWIWRDYPWMNLPRGWLGGPDVTNLRAHGDVFEDVVAFRSGRANLTGREGTEPASVPVMLASAGFFELLGVEPVLGRGFREGEDEPGADQVAVLSHDLWVSSFGRDPGLLGDEIYLDGDPVTVIGVAPSDFRFVKHSSLGEPAPAEVYLPLRLGLASLNPGAGNFAGLARVRDGVTEAQVDAAISAVAADLDAQWENPGLRMWGVGLKEDLVSEARPALVAILGAAAFLILVLGANLATLLLGRAAARDAELAVRAALGAGRRRLLETVLSESVAIAALGALLGVGLAVLGADVLRTLTPANLPRRDAVGVDASVVVAAFAVTLLMTVGAGLPPALAGARRAVAARLRAGSARSGGGVSAARVRGGLVIAQVALSVMLLIGAALLTRGVADLMTTDPGFDGEGVLTFAVRLDPGRYEDAGSMATFDRRLREALDALPQVEAVGAANSLPLSARADQTGVTFPGAPGNVGEAQRDGPLIDVVSVGPGYVEAAGLRLLQGRTFRDSDAEDAPGVALIDDVLARRFFPEGNAVGATAILYGDTTTVVGVVDQARLYSVRADDRGQVYRPLAQRPDQSPSYAVRTSGPPEQMVAPVRRLLADVDAEIPMTEVQTLEAMLRASMGRERLSLTLLAAFAGAALLLATLGLYGVVANAVTRRRHEMGVRIALGAEGVTVVGMVVRQGLALALVGVLLGTAGGAAAAGLLEGLIAGIDTSTPWVYAAVAATLLAVAGVASYLPAARASRIDPVEALRAD